MKTQTIDTIHDTRQLCTRFRIDGIKAMSRVISGGKQKIKFAKARNRGRLCLFSQNETKRKDDLIVMQNVRFEFRQNQLTSLMFAVWTSTVRSLLHPKK